MRHRSLLTLICFLMLFVQTTSRAQLTPDDSLLLNSRFAEQLYMLPSLYPGNWYLHNSASVPADIDSFLNLEFRFTVSDFQSANSNMMVATNKRFDTLLNPTFNQYFTLFGNAYLQLNPLIEVDFELNAKASTAFATFTPSNSPAEREIAFLVIPGSNANQTTELIRGSGYHNANCFLKQTLSQHGDVFILCKPLEDYRALRWNEKKMNSADYINPGANYIYQYLDSIGKPYGINYLVEAMALLKYMKSQYKKVMLLGCSQGGYASLLLSLNAQPDATLIASGYSKYIDEDSTFQFGLKQNFNSLPLQNDSQAVKNHIAQSTSEYLFSWPNHDSYWYQVEHNTHATQHYFGNLKNCAYFYNYSYHSFPTCYTIDTFIRKIINKPKLFFIREDSLTGGNVSSRIEFCGHGPFSFNVYRDKKLFRHYNWVSSPVTLTLPPDGMYTINDIVNLKGDEGHCFDTLHVKRIFNGVLFQDSQINVAGNFEAIAESMDQGLIAIPLHELNGAMVRVFSISGQEIAQTKITNSKLELDTASLGSGLFIVHIRLNEKTYTLKILN